MKNNIITAFTWILIIMVLCSCEKSKEKSDHNSLIGVWQLMEIIDQNGLIVKHSELKVSFADGKCATIFGPCIFSTANYSINGFDVVVDHSTLTKRCVGDNESDFISGLSGTYNINDDTLSIASFSNTSLTLFKTSLADPYKCDLSRLLVDTMDRNKYYTEEIFNAEYAKINGKWFAYNIEGGGWRGGSGTLYFDFFEVRSNGIYGFIKNFDVLEYGKILIERQTEEQLRLVFEHDENSVDLISMNKMTVEFISQDTMILHDYCLDCYHTYLARVK